MTSTATPTLEQMTRDALSLAIYHEAWDVAAHLAQALHAHTGARPTFADTVQVPLLGQTRSEAPRTAETLCRCPRNDAGRVGTAPDCPIHQPGAAGLHAVPTERLSADYRQPLTDFERRAGVTDPHAY